MGLSANGLRLDQFLKSRRELLGLADTSRCQVVSAPNQGLFSGNLLVKGDLGRQPRTLADPSPATLW